jgi:hypothetical protein
MKLLGIQTALLMAIVIGAASCTSCSDESTKGTGTPASKFIKPTPEESLTFIMDTFKRRIEETPIGFVIADSNGRSTMTGTNKVSYEVIKPAEGATGLKAVVTVTSQSRYSIKRTKETSDSNADDANAKRADPLADPADEENGVESFDPVVSGKSAVEPSSSAPRSEDVVARRPDEETRKYELVYEGDRWKLVTELDPDTESSIQNAFKNALDSQ